MSDKKPSVHRPDKCGTTKGWNAHNYYNEEQCSSCRQSKTDYTRLWRRRTGRTKSTLVPLQEAAA